MLALQYDFGKYENDGFILKGSLDKPPPILISAGGSLEEDEMMNKSPLRKILKHIIKKSKFMPPSTNDILFDQRFHHVNKGYDCSGRERSDQKKLVFRAVCHQKQPVVHRGHILSGSDVVKYPPDRDGLRRRYKDTICFEMEVAGIMDEIPRLVILGICDYADTHKQDGWHHYAAAAAASYCKAVLGKVDHQELKATSSTRCLINESMKEIKEGQRYIVISLLVHM